MGLKISQLTAKGSNLAATDLLEISEVSGLSYVSKRITGQQILNAASTLTVGTTAVASGTIGRVFFQGTGNVLQQSANLFWDNSNNALGLGASPLSTSRLDIRAKDALSTSQSLRIRNSIDNATQFEISGNGLTTINGNITASSAIARGINITSTLNAAANNDVLVGCDVSPIFSVGAFTGTTSLSGRFTGRFRIVNGILDVWDTRSDSQNRNWSIIPNSQVFGDLNIVTSNANGGNPQTAGTSRIYISPTGNVGIGGTSFGTNAAKVFAQYTGTDPSTSPTDAFQMYSADVVGGNAAPHFRTENGNVVKIYQETTGVGAATLVGNAGTNITDTDTFDGYTLKQVVKALKNLGILA
jgi:hypothetical protein